MFYVKVDNIIHWQVSTPRDLSLEIDSADDWSITMATPTCLRGFPVGSTPVITTTDEDVSGWQDVLPI